MALARVEKIASFETVQEIIAINPKKRQLVHKTALDRER